MWIWNENPDALLIYRGVDHENYPDAGLDNAPRITVTDIITGQIQTKVPAGVGFNRGVAPYNRSDLPYRFGRLPFGLSRVQYVSGATATGQFLGNFEIWDAHKGRCSNALRETGFFQKAFTASPPTQLELLPELEDGSNSYGLFAGDVVDIYADVTLPSGAGLVIHSSGYGGSGGIGSKTFSLLYRSTSFLTFYPGHITDGGEISLGLGSVLAQGAFAPAGNDLKLRIRIWREGDSQRVQVLDAFTNGNLVIDATRARADYPIHWAGVVGGLLWNNTSVGGNAILRTLTIERS